MRRRGYAGRDVDSMADEVAVVGHGDDACVDPGSKTQRRRGAQLEGR